ncbi:MAG: hypothetical protein HKN26_08770, partial [Acidimicrobiales bacterium]|nr:hypothetical protein [Acidimicrobiales bacterium]
MIIWSEVRGLVAVAATVAAIIALFAYIPTIGDDENFYDETSVTTTTVPPTTTIDTPLLAGLDVVLDLCDLAQDFADGSNSDLYDFPGKVPQLAQEFYDQAYDLSVGDVRAEYAAARSYYEDYNEVARP